MRINNEPTFKGINVAKAANKNMKIYDVTSRDVGFLEDIYKFVKIKKLMPNISLEGEKVYDSIMKQGLRSAQSQFSHAMLLSYDDTVCGLMVDIPYSSKQYLDYLCTWPVKKDEKAPFGAQTLFQQLFKNFLNTDKPTLELDAIRYGKAITLYQRLGFKPVGGDAYYETMRATRDKVREVFQNLQKKIPLIAVDDSKDLDLHAELNIPTA